VELESLWHWRTGAEDLILYEGNEIAIERFWYINGFLVFFHKTKKSHVKVE